MFAAVGCDCLVWLWLGVVWRNWLQVLFWLLGGATMWFYVFVGGFGCWWLFVGCVLVVHFLTVLCLLLLVRFV